MTIPPRQIPWTAAQLHDLHWHVYPSFTFHYDVLVEQESVTAGLLEEERLHAFARDDGLSVQNFTRSPQLEIGEALMTWKLYKFRL